MTWTTDEPTAGGWYWLADPQYRTVEPVEVRLGRNNEVYFVASDIPQRLPLPGAKWFGPMVPPGEE
jgi:hypothetical protein